MAKNNEAQLVALAMAGAIGLFQLWKATKNAHQRRLRLAALRAPASVSSRGLKLNQPALPYLPHIFEAFESPYHPTENPNGLILLAVAENKLVVNDVLKEPLLRRSAEELPDSIFNYDDLRGTNDFRTALAKLFNTHVMPGVTVSPQHICASAGVAACISNLFYCIVEAGDAILVPAPYYSAFDVDLTVIPGAVVCKVVLEAAKGYTLTLEALETSYQQAMAAGHFPAALLLTNPHNPLGRCMSTEEMTTAVSFCQRHGMHLVSDEIYALSVFREYSESSGRGKKLEEAGTSSSSSAAAAAATVVPQQEGSFISLAQLVKGELGDFMHVLWGFSKDFGMSGLRVGCIYTQNQQVMNAQGTLTTFTSCSLQTQASLTRLLGDEEVISSYIRKNAEALGTSYDIVYDFCSSKGIKCLLASAGMFAWVDLRPLLTQQTWEAEAELMEELVVKYRIVLTPGSAQHAEVPGFFRICYAFVQPDTLRYALSQLGKAMQNFKHLQ